MHKTNTYRSRAAWLAMGVILLLLCLAGSVLLGATNYSWATGWASIAHYNADSNDQIIIRTTRLPRAFIAVTIGASLAIAGALMQTLTRNPLAAPSVLGVNAGAGFFVVTAAVLLSVTSMQALMWISFMGAAVAAITVYVLGSAGRGGLTPLKIILAGAAMTALFSSVTQGILALDKQGLTSVLFWLTGTIAGRSPEMLMIVFPYMAGCWLAAWLLSNQLNVLRMGDETAKGLGQRTVWLKAGIGIIVVMLAGGSVAVAGPIGFIGIVVPHVARYFAGLDHRWLIPYCAVSGAILLLLADIGARFIMIPEEMPVGVMTAAIGAPFFMYIARKGIMKA
ncbi:FecCD family ABC transporter permease [Paenibacillus sp. YIM B09110]|uniref:FecCD family ABC transporter permease n=1 Tax=Paenibacillus sp. YIM B09110 TaxID=3126102 RepID=UPI00301E14FA